MKEKIIDIETAILAESKEYNIPCWDFIDVVDEESSVMDFIGDNFEEKLEHAEKLVKYWRPTQSLLKKWLRETHNIGVESYHDYDPKDKGSQFYTSWGHYNGKEIDGTRNVNGWYDEYNHWKKYEDALEFGLVEALKMVKSAEKKTKNN